MTSEVGEEAGRRAAGNRVTGAGTHNDAWRRPRGGATTSPARDDSSLQQADRNRPASPLAPPVMGSISSSSADRASRRSPRRVATGECCKCCKAAAAPAVRAAAGARPEAVNGLAAPGRVVDAHAAIVSALEGASAHYSSHCAGRSAGHSGAAAARHKEGRAVCSFCGQRKGGTSLQLAANSTAVACTPPGGEHAAWHWLGALHSDIALLQSLINRSRLSQQHSPDRSHSPPPGHCFSRPSTGCICFVTVPATRCSSRNANPGPSGSHQPLTPTGGRRRRRHLPLEQPTRSTQAAAWMPWQRRWRWQRGRRTWTKRSR